MSVFVLLLIAFATTTRAEETLPDNIGPDSHALPEPDETHPIYSTNAHWVESVAIAAAGLFLAAAVIGPIVRAEAPDAVPEAMSHEEDPSADRH